jgi:cytochrome c-type biogenesis protein CcmE
MTPRRRRMFFIGAILGGVALSAVLALQAFRENLLYFFSPSQVVAGDAPSDRTFRLGGMVLEDSVHREPGSLTINFVITDFVNSVPVEYTGMLPPLFEEGQGIVTRGTLAPTGQFMAEEVLAKHDENYMSPEVAAALAEARESPSP